MEEQFKIEKGIPTPPQKKTKDILFTLAQKMQIGDSVVLSFEESIAFADTILTTGNKYTTRRLEDGNYRVWRVK